VTVTDHVTPWHSCHYYCITVIGFLPMLLPSSLIDLLLIRFGCCGFCHRGMLTPLMLLLACACYHRRNRQLIVAFFFRIKSFGCYCAHCASANDCLYLDACSHCCHCSLCCDSCCRPCHPLVLLPLATASQH